MKNLISKLTSSTKPDLQSQEQNTLQKYFPQQGKIYKILVISGERDNEGKFKENWSQIFQNFICNQILLSHQNNDQTKSIELVKKLIHKGILTDPDQNSLTNLSKTTPNIQIQQVNSIIFMIHKAGWNEILLSSEPFSNPFPFLHIYSSQQQTITFQPDFLIIRNECFTATSDYRNILLGFMHSGMEDYSVNSLQSVFSFLERPVIHGQLVKLNKKFGQEKFPIIKQSYFNNHKNMMYGGKFPCVVKVGHAHAGDGIQNSKDMEDFKSVLAMTGGKYCTAEPFIDGFCDIRIQKIGERIRVFKRIRQILSIFFNSISGNWKSNTGSSLVIHLIAEDKINEGKIQQKNNEDNFQFDEEQNAFEMIDKESYEKYKEWINLVSDNFFGGLDICTVDVIKCQKTGQDFILEVNGSSSGSMPQFEKEDNEDIVNIVLEKICKLY